MIGTERETVASCPHVRTTRRVVESEHFKRSFSAEVDECLDCGARLWTQETRLRFHQWLTELKHEKRDTFQIQFYLPDTARLAMQELLKDYPGVPMSALIRTMTAVYLSSLLRVPEFQAISNRVFELRSYQVLTQGRRRKTSLQFSPMALLDVQAWGEILKLPPHKVVEDAIYKGLALQNEADSELRTFWERNLWPQADVILRSLA